MTMIEGISWLGFCRKKQQKEKAAINISEKGSSNVAVTPSDISEGSQ
jgi:hypothetical protein